MATVSQTQPTIQLLLKTSDFVGALDLIYTTQEVLQQELSGIHCLRLCVQFTHVRLNRVFCYLLYLHSRHLGSQLAELENAIERMMECDFVSFLMEGLKQRLGSQERLSDQDEQTTEVCACAYMCMCVYARTRVCVCTHICACMMCGTVLV